MNPKIYEYCTTCESQTSSCSCPQGSTSTPCLQIRHGPSTSYNTSDHLFVRPVTAERSPRRLETIKELPEESLSESNDLSTCTPFHRPRLLLQKKAVGQQFQLLDDVAAIRFKIQRCESQLRHRKLVSTDQLVKVMRIIEEEYIDASEGIEAVSEELRTLENVLRQGVGEFILSHEGPSEI
jgi:hypothetical protein